MDQQAPSRAVTSWLIIALFALGAVTVAAIFWIFAHPFGVNWDEANYINRAYRDLFYLQQDGVGKFLQALVTEDTSRPPAFRILAIPFTAVFGASPPVVRFVSLLTLWVSYGFIFLTVKRLAGSAAGGVAVAFLAACPILVAANMRFYVDYPLNLAIAATLYYLLRDWNQKPLRHSTWIGLGIALGLGAMAKPPILFVAGPMLLLALVLGWRKIIVNPSPRSLIQSGAIALVIMLPWWVFNYRAAISKAFRSGGYAPHSLGPKGSLETIAKWLYVIAQSMIGPALTLLTLAILIVFIVQVVRRHLRIDLTTQTALWVCLVGALPLPMIAAISTNQNPRLISPALLPFAVAIALMAALTHWTSRRHLTLAAAAVICFQTLVIVSPTPNEPRYKTGDAASQSLLWGNPTSVMRRDDQWDWEPLRQIASDRNLDNPSIYYLGGSVAMSPPQISFPWIKHQQRVRVNFLWRSAEGDLDWDAVMETAAQSDIVLTLNTPPQEVTDDMETYQRYDVLDNQHNQELIRRMGSNPEFAGPIEFQVGQFEPTPVSVFVRR